jgi:hypothetical protein
MDGDLEPARLVNSLAETVSRIAAVASRLSAGQLATAPGPGAWSPNEILWHVRATADVYGEHILCILNEETPRWRHVSPRARMKKSRYDQIPFAVSFAAFREQRATLLSLLQGAPPEAWERSALIRVREREWRLTLRERVRGMADDEGAHCCQVEEAAAALLGKV